MTRRGRIQFVLGIFVLGLLVLILPAWYGFRQSENARRFDQIQVGMALADVQALFPTVEPNFGMDLVAKAPKRNWWLDDMVVSVTLDAENRVIAKATLRYLPEPWSATVTRWVGL